MSVTINISDQVAEHLNNLSLGEIKDVNQKLLTLLESEYRRRLTRYNLTDHRFSNKYGMSYDEFEKQKLTEKHGYTWEIESDAIAWETAIDGIDTIKRQLLELIGKN